ncbi:MAG: retropepsin-like domain-containing protein [Prevotella sp.]|nr:retropepsin-like domain-containing protein [Prevotella sp.]MBQ9649606.1 retropepsin-like domain-containing protein [Prevotella sp.]
MKHWLLLAVMLVVGIVPFDAQIKRYDTDFSVSQRDFLVAVPIEVERNQIFITLDFNGHPLRFKLDTGASQGVLYDDVQLPGVTTLGTIESEDAAGHIRQMQTVQLPPFNLGSLTISGFKVQRMRRNITRKGEDGIIGFALFNKGIAARIDTREHQLTLTDRRSHYAHTPGEALKYRLQKHVPYIKISPFANVDDEVLFDTGSPLPYAVNATSFAQIRSQHPEVADQIEGSTYGSHAMGHFGAERSGQIVLLGLQRLLWGNFAFHEVHCTTVSGGSHVGAPLLNYGAVVINPFRRQLVFQPYDGMTSVTVANHLHDIVIVERNGLAMIGMVMQEGKAWQAGFRPNTLIERVDGQPLTFEQFLSYCWVRNQEYQFTLRLPQGITTTLRAFWPLKYNQMD